MGMIRKYSRPLYDMAEHFDSLECDCDRSSDDNEWCEICGTSDFLTKQAKEVCKFEREVDEMIKETAKLKAKLEIAIVNLTKLGKINYENDCKELLR